MYEVRFKMLNTCQKIVFHRHIIFLSGVCQIKNKSPAKYLLLKQGQNKKQTLWTNISLITGFSGKRKHVIYSSSRTIVFNIGVTKNAKRDNNRAKLRCFLYRSYRFMNKKDKKLCRRHFLFKFKKIKFEILFYNLTQM